MGNVDTALTLFLTSSNGDSVAVGVIDTIGSVSGVVNLSSFGGKSISLIGTFLGRTVLKSPTYSVEKDDTVMIVDTIDQCPSLVYKDSTTEEFFDSLGKKLDDTIFSFGVVVNDPEGDMVYALLNNDTIHSESSTDSLLFPIKNKLTKGNNSFALSIVQYENKLHSIVKNIEVKAFSSMVQFTLEDTIMHNGKVQDVSGEISMNFGGSLGPIDVYANGVKQTVSPDGKLTYDVSSLGGQNVNLEYRFGNNTVGQQIVSVHKNQILPDMNVSHGDTAKLGEEFYANVSFSDPDGAYHGKNIVELSVNGNHVDNYELQTANGEFKTGDLSNLLKAGNNTLNVNMYNPETGKEQVYNSNVVGKAGTPDRPPHVVDAGVTGYRVLVKSDGTVISDHGDHPDGKIYFTSIFEDPDGDKMKFSYTADYPCEFRVNGDTTTLVVDPSTLGGSMYGFNVHAEANGKKVTQEYGAYIVKE